MSKINDAINDAKTYLQQIHDEFTGLIGSYHIGGDRKNGIEQKVAWLGMAIDVIAEETKPKQTPKITKKTTPEPTLESEKTPTTKLTTKTTTKTTKKTD